MRIALVLAALTFVVACGGGNRSTPTGPTPASPVSALSGEPSQEPSPFSGVMSARSLGSIVDWSRFVAADRAQHQPLVLSSDPPNAPANLAFTVTGTTLVLTWSPPAPGPTVNSYVIEAGRGAGLSNIARFNTGSAATTLTVTNVPAGTYFVRVRGANVDGESAPSNEVTIVIGGGPCAPPSPPTGLTGSASGSTVTLSWNAFTGAIAFIIEAGTGPGLSDIASLDTGSAATAFSANAPNGTYYIRIRVRTACGTSGVSNEVIVTMGGSAPPPGPTLSGLWVGTLTPRLSATQQVDFTHSGTSLTGVVRNRSAGQSITFQLAQAGPNTYSGNLIFEGTGGAACGAGSAPGSVQVTIGSPSTMAGTFTLPASGSCPSQTIQVQLTRQ